MRVLVYILNVVLIFNSCSNPSRQIKVALVYAGDNRCQLEEVLNYYKEQGVNNEKYKAAVFLIENMIGHYGYNKEQFDSLTNLMLPIINSTIDISDKQTELEKLSEDFGRIGFDEDIKIITAEYLINNIEQSFEVWAEPWCQHLDFNEFCEYILPYRCIPLQPLDNWRDTLKPLYGEILYADMKYLTAENKSSLLASKFVYRKMCDAYGLPHRGELHSPEQAMLYGYKGYPFVSAPLLKRPYFDTCRDFVFMAMANMRSKGIPIVADFTPQWAKQKSGHEWNVLLTNDHTKVCFSGVADDEPGGTLHKWDQKFVKAYRRTYVANEEFIKLNHAEDNVPDVFKTAFIRDVTNEYMRTTDVVIPQVFNSQTKNKYAYLAAYNNEDWIPLGYGKRKGKKITYMDVGHDAVLLPFFSTSSGHIAINYPFIINTNHQIKYLIPDTTKKIRLTLDRKYPVRGYAYHAGRRILYSKFEASNNRDFSAAETIHSFDEWQSAITVNTKSTQPYRYWRYLSLDYFNMPIHFAEMIFVSPSDTTKRATGKIIGTDGSYNNNGEVKELIFDGDILTCFDSPNINKGEWVGMDFGEPVKMDKVIFYPKSDGNAIEFGDKYELFYHNGQKWVSIGWQIAYDTILYFDNAPSGNTLFVLKDLTKGSETRPFTYENGKPVWW